MSDTSQILSASCNKCGAGLELPPGLRFATCQFCGSKLEVRFTGGVVYTDVLDASNDGDRQIAHDLQLIKLQNELNRLDQEWNLERERFRNHNGRGPVWPREPSGLRSVAIGLFVVAFGIFWIVGAASAGAPVPFVLFGVAVVVIIISVFVLATRRENEYAIASETYERKRARLLSTLRHVEADWGSIPTAPE